MDVLVHVVMDVLVVVCVVVVVVCVGRLFYSPRGVLPPRPDSNPKSDGRPKITRLVTRGAKCLPGRTRASSRPPTFVECLLDTILNILSRRPVPAGSDDRTRVRSCARRAVLDLGSSGETKDFSMATTCVSCVYPLHRTKAHAATHTTRSAALLRTEVGG